MHSESDVSQMWPLHVSGTVHLFLSRLLQNDNVQTVTGIVSLLEAQSMKKIASFQSLAKSPPSEMDELFVQCTTIL